ncbi:patatin-like phospholipase family protein [Thiotrichales bacterium 19S3-7]|nr:patatin-like phospholipase family protein [Thiotrichales bacterium 19S3-7]MCF6801079.1 patatin-like phospholipase family protein [Thiotrichales bacterium 19S3-11]
MQKIRILSVFGGGVRSIFPAMILMELERRLIEKSNRQLRLSDCFDLVAGTSIGGLITALILAPMDKDEKPYAMNHIYDLVKQILIKIFLFNSDTDEKLIRDPDYSSQCFGDCMADIFAHLEIKDLVKPSLITAYEPNRNWLAFFKSHYAKLLPEYNFYINDAISATCAMPFYFNPVVTRSFSDKIVRAYSFIDILKDADQRNEILSILKQNKVISDNGEILKNLDEFNNNTLSLPANYVLYQDNIYDILQRIQNPQMTFLDGALFANNPSMPAFIEANTIFNQDQAKREILLVSLGNGKSQIHREYSTNINQKFVSQLLSRLFSCSEKLGHFQTYHTAKMLGYSDNYYHFTPIIDASASDKINDVRKDNLALLENIALNYINDISEHLDCLVDKLLD